MESFQDWFVATLDRKQITAMQVSVEMKLPEGVVQSWEMGFEEPTPQQAVRLAEVLGEDPLEPLARIKAEGYPE